MTSLRRRAAATAAVVFAALLTGLAGSRVEAAQPPTAYPRVPQGTGFLNHTGAARRGR